MRTFFGSCRTFFPRHFAKATVRHFSFQTCTFELNNSSSSRAKLIKIIHPQSASHQVVNAVHNQVIKAHPNSLLVWTMPTVRINKQHVEGILPGHNFSSITNEKGEIVCTLSKRPDTTAVLGEYPRIDDDRFTKQSKLVRVFRAQYPSSHQEIHHWEDYARKTNDYPLFVHIIPLDEELGLSAERYQHDAEFLKQMYNIYSLHDWFNRELGRFIRASNCNDITKKVISGSHHKNDEQNPELKFCQDAIIDMMKRFAKNPSDYFNQAHAVGLTRWIEPANLCKEQRKLCMEY